MHVPESKDGLWRIGEVAEMLGITPKSLRHYERKELLRPPQRTDRGYRVYNDYDVRRAYSIVGLRRLGLSLQEIRGLFVSDKSGRTRQQRLLGLLDEKLREIDETVAILQGRRDDMVARYLALLDAALVTEGDCVCAAVPSCSCHGPHKDQALNHLLET